MTPHEATLTALAETNPRVEAALRALGPNRAGDPTIGLLGFMRERDCEDLVRAADLAHKACATPDWPINEGLSIGELARVVRDGSAWLFVSAEKLPTVLAAFEAYVSYGRGGE